MKTREKKNFYEKDIEEKQLDRKVVMKLLRYVAPYKLIMAFTVLLLLIIAALEIAGPYLIKIAIDKYLSTKQMDGFIYIIILFASVLAGLFIFRFFQQYLTEYLGQKIMYDLRMDIFRHIQKMEMSFFDKNPTGRLLTRVTTDVQALNEMLSSGIITFFGDIFMIAGVTIVMISLNLKLSLVTFSVLLLLAAATFVFRKKVRISFKIIRAKISNMNSFIHEAVTGINTVKLFNREGGNNAEFDNLNKDYLFQYLKTIFYYSVFFPVVAFISTLAVALIIWYGGGQVIKSLLTLGTLVAFIQYIEKFFHPLSDLAEKFGIIQEAVAASERIFSLLEEKPKIFSPSSPVKVKDVKGDIRFENVWFAYEKDNYILQDISFTLERGKSLAIVGATGSGKTSIINILNRFYDIQKGGIFLDGINIKEYDLEFLRRHIGIVMQDVFLFSGTILENIRLSNKDISFEQVVEAAAYVNADKFIRKLPDGYNTDIKERGQILSVGQRQLIAFARALVFNPEVLLVLDEATSSIDSEIEALIQDALSKIMKNRTTIVIAHRLSTIRNADNIIVLTHGRIVESGPHKKLLEAKAVYYKLYKYQYQLQV
ncbi:MAG: ABC transporter ATP-binding protein [Actinobacteria bacterium]|nr:ABC transporter ATP-binding protein [Actinomycetota bacterium]